MSNKINENDFGCHLFKTELVAGVLSQIDERIGIMGMIEEIRYIEGINIIEMWRNLYSEIKFIWLKDSKLIITLNKAQELKFRFLSDLVAQFFLYNGSDIDNEFLKNVSELFKDINDKYANVTTTQVWKELKNYLSV